MKRLLPLVVILLACGANRASGTALLVTVSLQALAPEQLRYAGIDLGTDTSAFGPALEPSTPGPVPDRSTVRVLLPDDLAGHVLEVRVEGTAAGATVGQGQASVTVQLGVETPLTVTLTAPALCTSASCPKGCCVGTTCWPGTDRHTCGSRGDACADCPRCTNQSCH